MVLYFSPLLLLLWVFLVCFIPGALLSFSIFRKTELLAIEKLLIGFGLGIIILPLIPFLLYILLGIKYSYSIAILSVLLFYGAAITFFVRSGAYSDFSFKIPTTLSNSKGLIIPVLLAVLVLVVFLTRLSTYSPIFMELDPYFYTYISQQLIVFGENPLNDKTAWFPDLEVSHRAVPGLSYLEALWYSFYTNGGSYDNMLLAAIASIYPPIAAALAVFFLYLLVSVFYRREWGILAAGIAAFMPIFIMKTLAGEMEVQPYAFFSLAFFFSTYARMLKENELRYAILAALGYVAIAFGSSSEILALSVMLLFIPLQGIFLFFKENDLQKFKSMLISNSIILVFGVLLMSSVVRGTFYGGISLSNTLSLSLALAFSAALYAIRQFLPAKNANYIFGLFVFIGLVLFFFTPIGDAIKRVGEAGIGVARYNFPLDRTIAEQSPAGADFSGEFGFVASAYPKGLDVLLGFVSDIINFLLLVIVSLINAILNAGIEFSAKANGMLMLWLALFGTTLAYSFYRLVKGESTPVLLIAVTVFPPLLIGLLKAKYTIYSGFLLAIAIGFIFGETEDIVKRWSAANTKNDEDKAKFISYGYNTLAVIAALIIIFQFTASASGLSPILLTSQISKSRFQDNPGAFAGKFQAICSQISAGSITEKSVCDMYAQAGVPFCTDYDSPICTVVSDPIGYANRGTNEQYNRKLCYYSLMSDIANPKKEEILAAEFRCQRLSEYWIESMEWIKNNTESTSRTISWWDYGHWINFFGQKNTVLRNEHASRFMIGEVAHDYVDGTPEDLVAFMRSRNSTYALFDKELIGSGGALGGKYGALNYLACARDNETGVTQSPSMSKCEADHLWEIIFVPHKPEGHECVISKSGNQTGILAYKAYWTWDQKKPMLYTPTYPFISGYACYGNYLNDQNTLAVCRNLVSLKPAYCVGPVTFATGDSGYGTYLLNETYPNGDLRLNRAIMELPQDIPGTLHLGDATGFTLFYSNDKIWLENGQITSGYEDRGTKFYSSNIYRALFMDEIPGFTKVFETKDRMVKIYKITE